MASSLSPARLSPQNSQHSLVFSQSGKIIPTCWDEPDSGAGTIKPSEWDELSEKVDLQPRKKRSIDLAKDATASPTGNSSPIVPLTVSSKFSIGSLVTYQPKRPIKKSDVRSQVNTANPFAGEYRPMNSM